MGAKKNIQLLPGRLMPNDTIGIVAPAGPFDRKEFDRGVAVLKAMGFRIVVPDDIHIKNGYLAGPDIHRANLINTFFADRKIKAIICARGGFGSMRILSLLDFELIKKNPKIFIGFSDISAILSVLYTKCGFVVFHGPMVTSLGDASRKTRKALLAAVSSDAGLAIRPKTGITIRHGLASGPVAGGNLTTLCHLIGTPFEPVFKGHILFLEDKGEACYRIDRMLSHMRLAGCFDDLAGLVLGSFKDCGPVSEIIGVVDNIFKEHNIPIITGFEVGHGKNNITIPIGLNATLDTGRQLLSFHEPATSNKHRAKSKEQPATSNQQPATSKATMKQVDSLMRQAISEDVFPGSVLLVARNDSIVFFEAYGYANIFSRRKMTIDTIFDLASLTKPLATTPAVMSLVQQRKLGLEQTLESILPCFKKTDKGQIKIKSLLCHNSGLPAYSEYYYKLSKVPPDARRKALKSLLVKESMLHPTGKKVLYSDLGFMILGLVVEAVAGVRLDHYVSDEIYQPLGIDSDRGLFFTDLNSKPIIEGFAATEICPWRNILLEGVVHDENAYMMGGVAGHAGLFGSAVSLYILLSSLLSDFYGNQPINLFEKDLLHTFFNQQEQIDKALGFETPSLANASCGDYFSRRSIGHLGFTGTSFWMDLERNIIVILLTNRVHPSRENDKIKFFRPKVHNAIMDCLLKL